MLQVVYIANDEGVTSEFFRLATANLRHAFLAHLRAPHEN